MYHNANAGPNWLHGRYSDQRKQFYAWLNTNLSKESDNKLVVIEIGCGSRLPFIRHPCEQIVDAFGAQGKLIRVNPTESQVPSNWRTQGKAIGLPYGALEGCSKLDQALRSLRDKNAVHKIK